MAEDLLRLIDKALESPNRAGRRQRVVWQKQQAEPQTASEEEAVGPIQGHERLPWVELFLAVQFLWGVLLFVPGAQPFRMYVRGLPYLSSAGMLVVYGMTRTTSGRPRATGLLAGSLLLLVANLLHPTSQIVAGFAQCLLQLCIAAPMFWAYKVLDVQPRFERALVLLLVMNLASASLGLLQVYYPDRFMPPQFNVNFTKQYLDSLSYVGTNGRVIFRPPGLSDQPGGAAIAGGFTALLGLGLMFGTASPVKRLLLLAAVIVGMAVIYLTQVRSVLVMVLVGGAVLSLMAIRQRRFAAATATIGTVAGLATAGFIWASAVGGAVISDRFVGLTDNGLMQTYQQDRGHYLTRTFGELLDHYPLGAGVGRWGIMNNYFGDESDPNSASIYVEPQLTGWLLDGGIPMWILYGGAVFLTIFVAFEIAGSPHPTAAGNAAVVVPLLVFITGLGMAGPIFNTQTGIIFWFLAAGLEGLHRSRREITSAEQSSRSFEAVGFPATRS